MYRDGRLRAPGDVRTSLFLAVAVIGALAAPASALAACPPDQYTSPSARIKPTSTSVAYGTSVSFDGSTSSAGFTEEWFIDIEHKPACDSTIVNDPIASWSWNLGDNQSGSGVSPSHLYATPGTYTPHLTVTTRDGHQSSTTAPTITVTGPVAAFTASSGPGWVKSFDAGGSTGPYALSQYAWDFGDGQTALGKTVSHTFTGAGNPTVTLTVTDVKGGVNGTASTHQTVNVAADAVDPKIAIDTPSADKVYVVGAKANAAYSCSDAGGSGLASCAGTVASGAALDTSTPGQKSFDVTARSLAGRTATAHVVYSVISAAPEVNVSSPADGAVYGRGATVLAAYNCTLALQAPSCDGPVASGTPIDTSALGHHTFTVLAANPQGAQTTRTVGYDVVDQTPPTIHVDAPLDATVLRRGQAVRSAFTCADDTQVASCAGPATLDTATPGTKTFTVTAVDTAGNVASTIVHYSVLDYPELPSGATINADYVKHGAIKITNLSALRVPAGATVTVACHGRGCPRHPTVLAQKKAQAVVALKSWKGVTLYPGARLSVSVTMPLTTGKQKLWVIGPHKAKDAGPICLPPGGKPQRCAA